ncbi:DUF1553 domain-containing protein [Chryseolinea sp. T2]|uniref:DUF1553 domain-containing protein n=1 Tax=Chryseolinea sp. T2 TaxID=3129255 RepID=UPI0030785F6F
MKRNANYSLLFRHEALDTAESGKTPILPGDAAHSELIRRITSSDPEVRMPYKESPLSQDEIDILKRWIDQGAPWGDHWAYLPPKPPIVPNPAVALSSVGDPAGQSPMLINPIDNFVVARLQAEKLMPSPTASKPDLMRRVYLDLVGVPPSMEQAQAFLSSTDPLAYEKLVDSLLASPRFGEKWASWWLDMARYADTKGYEKDNGRSIWKYRDWVIDALNADKPFDEFTREQLAGDLLDHPTDNQLIATAFHRNTMNNDEGGTDDEEFRVAALIDRIGTTWEVWQSTTMACVQCHTHPYDPFVHKDYYRTMAFFNNTRDEDVPGDYPNLRQYSKEDQGEVQKVTEWIRAKGSSDQATATAFFLKTMEPKYHPHVFDEITNGSLLDNKWLGIRNGGHARMRKINMQHKQSLLFNYWTSTAGGTFTIRLDAVDGPVIAHHAIEKGDRVAMYDLKPAEGVHDLYFSFDNGGIAPGAAVCAVEWLAFGDAFPEVNTSNGDAMRREYLKLLNAKPTQTPIMIENGPEQARTTQVFIRGNWMVRGDTVTADVPASLNPFPNNQPNNRLGFANWLMAPENPLTARAITNRVWEQFFGIGIVESLEDFGTQGAAPSHPELLDWLALRFRVDHQWHLKPLIRDIALSATYRQDSRVSQELQARDPQNRLLARGPRVRLSFEQLRDQALAVAGLLSTRMHGPSVMPYQPAGIWSSVYSSEKWKESEGEDRYRRSVYTYMKRTSPYPSMMMFDGSSREVCTSRRIRTNTPLQALVTMNDSSFLVVARHLAPLMMAHSDNVGEQVNQGYQRIMFREMAPSKRAVMERLYNDALAFYRTHDADAEKLMAKKGTSAEAAAITVVANALLNLDETIVKN